MSWNDPDADPVGDIAELVEEMGGDEALSDGLMPDTMIIGIRPYVWLQLGFMDFGWWPMSFFRRRAERRRLLAEYDLKPDRWWQ